MQNLNQGDRARDRRENQIRQENSQLSNIIADYLQNEWAKNENACVSVKQTKFDDLNATFEVAIGRNTFKITVERH